MLRAPVRWERWFAAGAAAVAIAACRDNGAPQRARARKPAASQPVAGFRPPKAPPPVRRPHTTPPLPDLPALAAQDRYDTKHARYQSGEYPCGGVSVGGRNIPVLCLEDMKGAFEEAAVALLPYGTIRPKNARLPAVVDHRAEGTEGPVRTQGSAPTCSAFALAAAADHAIARWTGAPARTSVMQIWSRYRKTAEYPAMLDNLEQPLTDESTWPYDARDAMSWMSPDACRSWRVHARCGRAPDADRARAGLAHPIAEVRQIEVLRPAADVDALRAKIAAGQDVVVGLRIGHSFAHTARSGSVSYVPDYEDTTGGHYLLLAGYASFPRGAYFLVHNSWGERWGDGGYAWIHEATLQRHAREAYVVDAHPNDAAEGARQWRVRAAATCSKDLVPDSITAACAPRCPDGSPRHADVCGQTAGCPDGYVNLTGTCVLAAPHTSGTHDETSIRFACGPSGCAYWLPKGEGGCTGAVCQISCPAPDFRIARDKHGLTCVE